MKRLVSFLMALVLLFQLTGQIVAIDVSDQADYEEEVQDVDVNQNLEDKKIAFVNGWVLFDVNGEAQPQGRNFEGAMRNVGHMPSSSHDLRHVSSVWSLVHNNGITRYEAFIDGRWVAAFCTQPGVPSVPNSNPHPGWSDGFGQLSASVRQTISLILMHGYDHVYGFHLPNGNSAIRQDAYVTTQVAIWEAVLGFWDVTTPWEGNTSVASGPQGDPWRRLISNTSQTSGASLQQGIGNATRMSMYDQIRRDIWTFHGQPTANRRPIFAGDDALNPPIHTLTWSDEHQRFQVILDDGPQAGGNGLLSRYLSEETGSFGPYYWYYEAPNRLTIYTTEPAAPQTNAPNDLLSIQPEAALAVMFWAHPVLQDKVTGNSNTPLTAHFGVDVDAIGNLEIIKYSETGVRIPDTTFRIVSDEHEIDTMITTNEDGIATLNNIPIGTFEVTEKDVPLPWALTDETFTIEVTGNTNEVVTNRLILTNELLRGSFELTKLSVGCLDCDEETDLWALPDVTFRLYALGHDLENAEVTPYYLATLTTDAHGQLMKNGLLYGDYKLVETVTHYRHQLPQYPIFFSISKHHEHLDLVVYNDQTQTQISKVDHLDRPLAGAHFQLLMYETDEVIYEWISTEEAKVIFALAHGQYILRETVAPDGFLLGEEIHFTVTDDASTLYIVAQNLPDHRVFIATRAHTGDGNNQYFTDDAIVTMFDDIEITHINIEAGVVRAFRAYLFARLPDESKQQIWSTDYIEYTVEYVLNLGSITHAQVSTTVDTSEFPRGTTFFWAETAYRQIQHDDDTYSWEADYHHNFDGSDKRQTLFPKATSKHPEQRATPVPSLPQTGTHAFSTQWIQLGTLGLGVALAKHKKKNISKQV